MAFMVSLTGYVESDKCLSCVKGPKGVTLLRVKDAQHTEKVPPEADMRRSSIREPASCKRRWTGQSDSLGVISVLPQPRGL